MKIILSICTLLLLSSCASTNPNSSDSQIDQFPMYGGMDRNSYPVLKAADDKLITDTTAHYGSREKASQAFVNNGFYYYHIDDLKNAMRRFNQAWLLDKENPEVYWGFGTVLHDKGQNCDAMDMMEKALSLNPPKNQGFYPDAGRIITLCGVDDQSLTDEERTVLFEKTENLFIEAESFEPKKGYMYSIWATAYYWRGDYVKAWEMVEKSEKNGGQLPKKFLGLLESKYERPN